MIECFIYIRPFKGIYFTPLLTSTGKKPCTWSHTDHIIVRTFARSESFCYSIKGERESESQWESEREREKERGRERENTKEKVEGKRKSY